MSVQSRSSTSGPTSAEIQEIVRTADNFLAKRQGNQGSWVKDKSSPVLEDHPELATAYASLARSYCQPVKGTGK
jgi:hypothetical protein